MSCSETKGLLQAVTLHSSCCYPFLFPPYVPILPTRLIRSLPLLIICKYRSPTHTILKDPPAHYSGKSGSTRSIGHVYSAIGCPCDRSCYSADTQIELVINLFPFRIKFRDTHLDRLDCDRSTSAYPYPTQWSLPSPFFTSTTKLCSS